MSKLFRLARILAVGLRFRLHNLSPFVGRARGRRLREALETLGPIFVKFGQVLSTRRDLLPLDIADELAKLQDQVPPFPSALARGGDRAIAGQSIQEVFSSFETQPVASASIAQVHLAPLHDGTEVAVKVLRPGVEARDRQRRRAARDRRPALAERLWADGRRLKPREVVAEFARHLDEELDLHARGGERRASCGAISPARRCSLVPAVYWDCARSA